MTRKRTPDGRRHVVIEGLKPAVDGGRFPVKRTVGDMFVVEADVLINGHAQLTAVVLYRKDGEERWREAQMQFLTNDRWRGEFRVAEVGTYHYTVAAWVDPFASWRSDFERRIETEDRVLALEDGAALIDELAQRAPPKAAQSLRKWSTLLRDDAPIEQRRSQALDAGLAALMRRYCSREFATVYQRPLQVVVDVEKARFSTWYEMFPRSCVSADGDHGTFKSCIERLPYVASMGFDVLYLPPIHPIGRTKRKGRDNALSAEPGDPGSPWAIGAEEGGHTSVHPQLGTLDDFRRLRAEAEHLGISIALDIAFQCSPDHPWVEEHPEWFRRRHDGTTQYAENPPKKYEDIYPLNFDSEAWEPLWEELRGVFEFWIAQGVHVFRVDNPHTKPFPFWQWVIRELKQAHPQVIFLAEAFTRPKVMHRLAKLGFTQSYTYFTWRNTKQDIIDYFTELTSEPGRDYFRPNLWPNTPDILNEYLQTGGRSAFMIRLILAATLAGNYGIYGPAFELCESTPREPGSEEYLHSEKYEIRLWNLDQPGSLQALIARVNRIRRENPALQSDWHLRFVPVDNDQIVAWYKATPDQSNIILAVVSLDPHNPQTGTLELPLHDFDLTPEDTYQMHDLLSDAHFRWRGARNTVQLDPASIPAHIFKLRRRLRSERDFDYFM